MTLSGLPPGGAVTAFEDIFTRYSALDITYTKDKPYAIAGLQSRLEQTYNTKSTYGIVHCNLLRSLLWQRGQEDDGGGERMSEREDAEAEVIPSWSWMKYKDKIQYGKITELHTTWNREIKLISPSSQDGQERHKLAAPMVRISQGCSIEEHVTRFDTDCLVRDEKKARAGWIRFDIEYELDIGNLGFIIVAQHRNFGWVGVKDEGWKEFAHIWTTISMDLRNVAYLLVVSKPSREHGYEIEVCRRLGVAAIQMENLMHSETAQAVWVL
jgi:hypothetical protein